MDLWKHKALIHNVAYNDEILLYALTEQNYDLDRKVNNLELATRENTAEVKKLVEVINKESESMTNVVDSQAKLIIENIKIGRQMEDMIKANSTAAEIKPEEPKVLWVGTSLSDQHLDQSILEEKTKTKVDKLKAFTITRSEGKKNKNLNAEDLVSKALENNGYEVLVLELGVNEVSNLNIEAEKHVLREHMRNHMEKLFHLALQYITDHPNLKVVVLNRLPRLDSAIRSDLSRWADQDMARLWEENGRLDSIVIESLNLQVGSARDKEDVFGRKHGTKSFGIHLRGRAGNKEFTYRATKLLHRVIVRKENSGKKEDRNEEERKREERQKEEKRKAEDKTRERERKAEAYKKEDNTKLQEKDRENEKRRKEEKQRRMASIRKREEESKRRIQENVWKENRRKLNMKKKEERMKRSDVQQQREYDESGREGQACQEAGRREGSSGRREGQARRPAWQEAGRREGGSGRREGQAWQEGGRREGSSGRREWQARRPAWQEAGRREGRREGSSGRREGQVWQEGGRRKAREDYEERRKARELRHRDAENRDYRRAVRGRRHNSPFYEAGEGRNEARYSRELNREVDYPRVSTREDRQYREEGRYSRKEREDGSSGWSRGREDKSTSGGRREVRQPRQEREAGYLPSMQEYPPLTRAGNGRRGAPAPPVWA